MSDQTWSWVLAGVGITGLFFVGCEERRWRVLGWSIGISAQFLWIGFAFASGTWGFLMSAAAYGGMNLLNLGRALRAPKRVRASAATTATRGGSIAPPPGSGRQAARLYRRQGKVPAPAPKVQAEPTRKPSPPAGPSGVSVARKAPDPVIVHLPGATFDAADGNVIAVTEERGHAVVHLRSGVALPVHASKAAALMEIKGALGEEGYE